MRIACGVEYDGSRFQGWQVQPHTRTVQGAVETALGRIAGDAIRTVCAGRTDAGVHASGQVIHFDTTVQRPERAWVMGTNTWLPPDVTVRWARTVDDEFHARFSTVDRAYRYLIMEGRARPALWRDRVAWTVDRLDMAAMRAASAHLLGEHDFSAFRSAACQAANPVRSIHALEIERTDGIITIDIRANAFLHNMVRIVAGTLMDVGRGEGPPEWVGEVLAARDRTRTGATAPPHGLYFRGPRYAPCFGLPPREEGSGWPGAGGDEPR